MKLDAFEIGFVVGALMVYTGIFMLAGWPGVLSVLGVSLLVWSVGAMTR